MEETLEDQIQRLGNYILENCEGYPNANEGACDCAIRIIESQPKEATITGSITEEEIRAYLRNEHRVVRADKQDSLTKLLIDFTQWMRKQMTEGKGEEENPKSDHEFLYCNICEENTDWINAVCQKCKPEEGWISVDERTPVAYETGDWDGQRSDIVICQDEKEAYHIALLYEDRQGIVWYDKDDFELSHKVVKWQPLS